MMLPSKTRSLAVLLLALALGGAAAAAGKPRKPATPRTAPAPAADAASAPGAGQGRCTEEEALPSRSGRDAGALETSTVEPRDQLQELVRAALQQSRAIGAARLLAQAAQAELEETKASRLPQVSVGGTLGPLLSRVGNGSNNTTLQARATLSVSAPLYDAGRIGQLTEWRRQLFESAKYGQSSAEEQLALQTVSLALDRGRYVLQAQIYGQYVRKMACLVDALGIIVKADKGRSSELVQAQKSLQQADLSYETTLASLRSTETRLKRLVGEQLPPSASMSTVLARIPDLNESLQDIQQSPDVLQAAAQARAQQSYAESVVSGQKPQVSWVVTGSFENRSSINSSTNAPPMRDTELMGGVSVNIPILQPGANDAARAAYKRAEAAGLQRDETIEAKRYRMMEMYDTATSAMDRVRRIVEVLRNSDRVRASTLQQWQQLGRRSLFDVMSAESDYYATRVAHVNTLYDAQQVIAMMWSMGRGVVTPLR